MSKFRKFLEASPTNPNLNMVGTDPFGMYGHGPKMTQGEMNLAALQKLNSVAQNIHAAIQSGNKVGKIQGTSIIEIPEKAISKGSTRYGLSHQDLLNLIQIGVISKDSATGLYTIRTGNLRQAYVNSQKQAGHEKTLQSIAPAALAATALSKTASTAKNIMNKPGAITPWWKSAGFH